MKNQKRKDYFVPNYFDTIEGTNAFNVSVHFIKFYRLSLIRVMNTK